MVLGVAAQAAHHHVFVDLGGKGGGVGVVVGLEPRAEGLPGAPAHAGVAVRFVVGLKTVDRVGKLLARRIAKRCKLDVARFGAVVDHIGRIQHFAQGCQYTLGLCAQAVRPQFHQIGE